jgi:hypothetical protein
VGIGDPRNAFGAQLRRESHRSVRDDSAWFQRAPEKDRVSIPER